MLNSNFTIPDEYLHVHVSDLTVLDLKFSRNVHEILVHLHL